MTCKVSILLKRTSNDTVLNKMAAFFFIHVELFIAGTFLKRHLHFLMDIINDRFAKKMNRIHIFNIY